MKVVDPGHEYILNVLDGNDPETLTPETLTFVKRDGEGYPGNVGSHSGTTTQEVLRALVDRIKYVDNQIHDDNNDEVLSHLRLAIFYLELRAAKRHGRILRASIAQIELEPTCPVCGHIECDAH